MGRLPRYGLLHKLGSRSTMIAYGLIGLGILALVNNLVQWYRYFWLVDRLLGPLLILGLGIFILYRSTRNKKEDLSEEQRND